MTYLGTGNNQLNLSSGRAHDLAELLADSLEYSKTVVLSESREEVLDGFVRTRGTHVLL